MFGQIKQDMIPALNIPNFWNGLYGIVNYQCGGVGRNITG
jgi:hypothetical protein